MKKASLSSIRNLIFAAYFHTEPVSSGDQAEAQEMLYDSYEADGQRRLALLQNALEKDPGNADGLLTAAEIVGFTGAERRAVLRQIVMIGERRFKEDGLDKVKDGNLWGTIDARKYLRARYQYGEALVLAGDVDEAIVEFKALLNYSKSDNLGARYALLPLLLAKGLISDAVTLRKKFKEDSAVWLWSRVLEEYLTGNIGRAASSLASARSANAHFEPLLLGTLTPQEVTGTFSSGSEEEANVFAHPLIVAFRKRPDAKAWLEAA